MKQTVDVFDEFNEEVYNDRMALGYDETFRHFTGLVNPETAKDEYVERATVEFNKVVEFLKAQNKTVFFVKGLVACHNGDRVVMKTSKYQDVTEVDFGNNDVVYVGSVCKWDNPSVYVLTHS